MSSSIEPEESDTSSQPFQSAQQPQTSAAENEELLLSEDNEIFNTSAELRKDTDGYTPILPQDTKQEDARQSEEETPQSNEEDSSQSTRPNRFRGPASTWKNRTAPERELAASLDKLTAKDLSVHLYNAFMLKKRGAANRISQGGPNHNEAGEDYLTSTWVPPKVWTAWPMSADVVPRELDERKWEEPGQRWPPPPYLPVFIRPGQNLKELIVAQVLRKAREKFAAREWESEAESPVSRDDDRDERRTPEPRQRNAKGRFERSRSKSRSRNLRRDAKSPHKSPQIKSPAKKMDRSSSCRPVLMADDERATQILEPTVQHIMTKLDDLFTGLHRARDAYVKVDPSLGDPQGEGLETPSNRGSSSERNSRKRKRGRSTRRDAASTNPSSDDQMSTQTVPRKRKKTISRGKSLPRRADSQAFRRRKRQLGLRDWSDVLGMASLTGFDQSAVERAAARCADLFGESMGFRTLVESKDVHLSGPEKRMVLPSLVAVKSEDEGQDSSSHGSASVEEEEEKGGEGGEMFGGVHVDGYLQPIKGRKSWKYKNRKKKEEVEGKIGPNVGERPQKKAGASGD